MVGKVVKNVVVVLMRIVQVQDVLHVSMFISEGCC